MATLSDDGYVSIAGRGKDLIISGGLNIYPKEIEDVLNDQEGVIESAVVGVLIQILERVLLRFGRGISA